MEKTRADTFVELGSGASEKIRVLLKALSAAGLLQTYAPSDVSGPMLRSASEDIAKDFPHIKVHGVLGDYNNHLGNVPKDENRLIVFLGGADGNMRTAPRMSFLAGLRKMIQPGDAMLVGTDVAKEPVRHLACYDNPIASELNLNLLKVINTKCLDGDFDVENFRHVVEQDEELEEIPCKLRSQAEQQVYVREVGLLYCLAKHKIFTS